MFRLKLHWQILLAITLGAVAGWITGREWNLFGLSFYDIYDFFGTLFLNALRMLVIPLIVTSITSGISTIAQKGTIGRLGGKTVGYYTITSLIAILTGLALVNLLTPGIINGEPSKLLLGLEGLDESTLEKIHAHGAGDIAGIFLRMVPPNIVKAALDGQFLGLIVFSLLFGYGIAKLKGPHRKTLTQFWQGAFQIFMNITDLIIKFAPIGVFALSAKVTATTGLSAFQPLAMFFFTVLLALGIHMFITLPLILKYLARVSPIKHFKAVSTAILTAFSTSSSSATLPITMECIEEKAGVPNRITSFVLPLGATINMDGTALYECVAVIFIAQVYGIHLGIIEQFLILFIALLTSIGVAGIPAASLVAITVILTAVGLPLEGVGIILAVDRLLDMARTSVNVYSDTCGTVLIAKSEGEKGILVDS
ncbi:MAG: dicarboxylate/amino acid:cation symporter [Alphaproteobacteria bacterium]|nr:dicarboxylate/amino acid:cation symporter [Alphaproteobacteria bacterium]MBT5389630.1 dicarboxylate/amino acid:cation symporter [Alphaproteobacteria bacterium]MBT5540912.1 dicarboxylate/amino acid:cation symporter [Alphaproteobacteria bacterium]MBT5654913.1 dicarboxylate/amino acid:cation symporter [Alphaproteobacteria bacterium]